MVGLHKPKKVQGYLLSYSGQVAEGVHQTRHKTEILLEPGSHHQDVVFEFATTLGFGVFWVQFRVFGFRV